MHTVALPRTCLGFTNFLFFLFGMIGFFICLWCSLNPNLFKDVNYTVTKSSIVDSIADFLSLKLWYTPMTSILIPIAFVTMLTSCCGILGAGCRMKCAIKSYVFLATVLSSIAFWIFFITGIYNIYSDNQKTRLYLERSLIFDYGKESDMITFLWNYTMQNYECCGVNGYRDFNNSQWHRHNPVKLYPIQCCKLLNRDNLTPVSQNCTLVDDASIESYKNVGCFLALRRAIIENKVLLIFYIVFLGTLYSALTFFAYCIIRGEPLIKAISGGFTFLPARNVPETIVERKHSYDTMSYMEEPPKKVVKVVSSANPFQTYKYAPSAPIAPSAYDHGHLSNTYPQYIGRPM
ncbi:tetraspanin-1-like [Plodia interpunctella]|uniref:tetraspanin-1-like n=1 Tax=Plodia interpunctella TaxID=58824 RepID=UPI0023682807|nr:tetraspanin-1-like [Plodia interpunctella]